MTDSSLKSPQYHYVTTNSTATTGPDDFELMKVVGKGAFGKVFQARGKQCGTIFALKVVDKPNCSMNEAHLRNEIKVLQNVKSPFLCKMSHCFETDEKVYMILEFMQGGEMFTLLNKKELLSEKQAKFYAAQVTLALEHLHSNNVIYRDLKHTNVMLDSVGHVKLTDFGFSKFNFRKGMKTSTFCGTIECMAPEILRNEPYGHEVDVWALGCFVYDMLCGGSPFGADTDDETAYNIIHKPLSLPAEFSPECKEFMMATLKRRVNSRIEIEEIQHLAFFREFDWDVMAAQGYQPPFQPKIGGDDDVSQFETCYTDLPAQESPCKVVRSKNQIKYTDPFIGFESDSLDVSSAQKSKRSAHKVSKPQGSPKKSSSKQCRQK